MIQIEVRVARQVAVIDVDTVSKTIHLVTPLKGATTRVGQRHRLVGQLVRWYVNSTGILPSKYLVLPNEARMSKKRCRQIAAT